jgi:Group II intron, maturase-specific domain/Reverse transcriptase (RNA-dependent DNA polymerase)
VIWSVSAKASIVCLPLIKKVFSRSKNCASACRNCDDANRLARLSCRRSPISQSPAQPTCASLKRSIRSSRDCGRRQVPLMYQNASASCGFSSRKFSSATTKSSFGTASLCPTDQVMVPLTGAQTPRRRERKVIFCVRGALSPLLSNLMLDVLDKELEKRGHHFVRYADDCNIYVRSQKAGERVMAGIEKFLAKRLKLKVNKAKSAVAKPSARKFLGFSFTNGKQPRRRIAPQAIARCKAKVRELTRRTGGQSLSQVVKELSRYLVGWRGYFGFCETPSVLRELDQWIRRRLRAIVWKQWRRGRTRYAELRRRGVGRDLAACTAGSPHGPWRLSNSPALASALPNAFLASLALPSLAATKVLHPPNRRIRTRMCGGVGGAEP